MGSLQPVPNTRGGQPEKLDINRHWGTHFRTQGSQSDFLWAPRRQFSCLPPHPHNKRMQKCWPLPQALLGTNVPLPRGPEQWLQEVWVIQKRLPPH